MRTDEAFIRDFMSGDDAVWSVAGWLHANGFDVEIPGRRLRPHVNERAQFDDGGLDLSAEGLPLQVKCRFGYRFSGPADFGFPTVIHDTVKGYAALKTIPFAHVLVSQDGSGYIAVPYWSRPYWAVVNRYDPTRRARREFYECPIAHTLTIDDLARSIQTYSLTEFNPLEPNDAPR